MGPAVARPPGEPRPFENGRRPRAGFSPTTPTVAAGIRMDPPASDAVVAGSMPVATAMAAPPLDPPAPVRGSHGLRAGTPAAGSVYPVMPNSGVEVLPRLTDPRRSSAAARGWEVSGTYRSQAFEP